MSCLRKLLIFTVVQWRNKFWSKGGNTVRRSDACTELALCSKLKMYLRTWKAVSKAKSESMCEWAEHPGSAHGDTRLWWVLLIKVQSFYPNHSAVSPPVSSVPFHLCLEISGRQWTIAQENSAWDYKFSPVPPWTYWCLTLKKKWGPQGFMVHLESISDHH